MDINGILSDVLDQSILLLDKETTEVDVVSLLMRILQQRPELKGKGGVKKELLITVFTSLLDRGFIPDEAESFLPLLPALVDGIKEGSKLLIATRCFGCF